METGISRLYYNEREAIEHTHPKVKATVQYIDGRFPGFSKINDSDFSTDGSNELIDSFPNTERYSCMGYITMKQNFAFEKAARFDALLKTACDEYIKGDWNLFCKNLEKFVDSGEAGHLLNIKYTVLSGDPRNIIAKPRLFLNPGRFSMGERHHHFLFEKRHMGSRTIATKPDVEGIEIVHDNRVRPRWRDQLMTKYQEAAQGERDAPAYKRIRYVRNDLY